MAFITAAIIDAAIGAPLRNTLTDNSASTLAALINAADARTRSDLKQAGYTVSASTYNVTPSFTAAPIEVQHASLGYFLRMGFVRRNLPIPEDFAVYTEAGPSIAKGDLLPDGLEPDEGEGVGAVAFTSSDDTLTTGIAPQFTRQKLDNF